ncbi:hypothetical protein K8I28_10325 [bacterium]|nr:hypothetical protein [bacterium]
MSIGGLIVTHGRLGDILIEECARLMGESEHFIAFSTHQLSGIEISEKVKKFIEDKPWIVFVDAPGTAPAIRSQVSLVAGQVVITGVNLPVLLSFLVNRESLGVEQLANKLILDGKRSQEMLLPL